MIPKISDEMLSIIITICGSNYYVAFEILDKNIYKNEKPNAEIKKIFIDKILPTSYGSIAEELYQVYHYFLYRETIAYLPFVSKIREEVILKNDKLVIKKDKEIEYFFVESPDFKDPLHIKSLKVIGNSKEVVKNHLKTKGQKS